MATIALRLKLTSQIPLLTRHQSHHPMWGTMQRQVVSSPESCSFKEFKSLQKSPNAAKAGSNFKETRRLSEKLSRRSAHCQQSITRAGRAASARLSALSPRNDTTKPWSLCEQHIRSSADARRSTNNRAPSMEPHVPDGTRTSKKSKFSRSSNL